MRFSSVVMGLILGFALGVFVAMQVSVINRSMSKFEDCPEVEKTKDFDREKLDQWR